MELKDNIEEEVKFLPGVYASSTTSGLKSIANKPMEAYISKRTIDGETVAKRKNAEASMVTSSFRAQPFVSPFSGLQKVTSKAAVVAHGIFDRQAGKMLDKNEELQRDVEKVSIRPVQKIIIPRPDLAQEVIGVPLNFEPEQKEVAQNEIIIEESVVVAPVTEAVENIIPEPVFTTEADEVLAPTTYVTEKPKIILPDVAKILASSPDISAPEVPIQGRLVFSTLEGEFEIEANLLRVKLEDSDVYAQYDRELADVLDEQFGKFKGPKPFSRIVPVIESEATEKTVEVEVQEITEQADAGIADDSRPKLYTLAQKRADLAAKKEKKEAVAKEKRLIERKQPLATPEISTTKTTKTNVQETVTTNEEQSFPKDFYYEVPSVDLLDEGTARSGGNDEWAVGKMEILERAFENFGVAVTVTGNYMQGATVTQFEIAPKPGTKVSRIKGLADDLKLSLSVDDLRIEAIAGKNTIGIEIPNDERRIVKLKEVLSSPEFILDDSPLLVGLGEDISGAAVYTDILTMPHGLVAGQTGSGKSVCINTILVSILCKSTPETVRLMLIDPKRVEMAPYNDIPHLVTPVITDEKKAATALSWAVEEMERRYDTFAKNSVRDIKTFNKKRKTFAGSYENMPYIVIIIDELADLMMVAAQDVEDSIMRLTQKARAAGIHLIVATQRPTVNVITGTIKSNVPSRIAFAVAQANDSRVILDGNGAEDLLGRGDMLIAESGNKIRRVQGAFVSDDEVARIVDAAKAQAAPRYLIAEDALEKRVNNLSDSGADPDGEQKAMKLFIEEQKASVSLIQRKLQIGYNRAARIVDQLEEKGWISAPIGAASKRDVLLTLEEFNEIFSSDFY